MRLPLLRVDPLLVTDSELALWPGNRIDLPNWQCKNAHKDLIKSHCLFGILFTDICPDDNVIGEIQKEKSSG